MADTSWNYKMCQLKWFSRDFHIFCLLYFIGLMSKMEKHLKTNITDMHLDQVATGTELIITPKDAKISLEKILYMKEFKGSMVCIIEALVMIGNFVDWFKEQIFPNTNINRNFINFQDLKLPRRWSKIHTVFNNDSERQDAHPDSSGVIICLRLFLKPLRRKSWLSAIHSYTSIVIIDWILLLEVLYKISHNTKFAKNMTLFSWIQ